MRLGLAVGGLLALAVLAWHGGRSGFAIDAPRPDRPVSAVRPPSPALAPSALPAQLVELPALAAGDARAAEIRSFVQTEAARNPGALLRAILSLEPSVLREECLSAFFSDWVAGGPPVAVAWLLSEPPALRLQWAEAAIVALAGRPSTLQPLVAGLVRGDPAHASAYLSPAVALLAADGDFTMAANVTTLSDDPVVRQPLREKLAADWGRDAPREAAAWVLTLGDSPERDGILGRLAETWSGSDPAAVADFALALPETLGRTHALTLGVQAWAERDVVAATAWLASRWPAADLDTPIFTVATNPALLAASPAAAAQWAECIENPDVRLQGLRVILAEWAARDRLAALAFLTTTSAISDEFRRTLLMEIDSG